MRLVVYGCGHELFVVPEPGTLLCSNVLGESRRHIAGDIHRERSRSNRRLNLTWRSPSIRLCDVFLPTR
jgi:hypothetical protein